MAKRNDVGGNRTTVTPTLDPTHELPSSTESSPLGTTGSVGTGTLGNTSTLGNTGSGLGTSGLGNTGTTGTGLGTSGLGTSGQGMGNQEPQGTMDQAKEQAKNLASEAKDQTKKVADQARDQVQELVGRQKDQAADRLGSLAGALREAGRKLNEGEQAGDFGRYADRAAEQMERVSGYLRDNDLRGFVRDTESFARRRPDLFLGGTFLAGLMLARFVKASSPDTGYRGGYDGGNWTGYPDSARRTSNLGATGTVGTTGTAGARSTYTPERRDPVNEADLGATPYNDASMGV